MRVLVDSCVWGGVHQALVEAGHDAVWTGHWKEDPGDDEILSNAFQERRVLVTIDKDFGTLVFLHGRSHSGIIRLVNLSTRQQAGVCLSVLSQYEDALLAGAIITAEEDRVRVRRSRGS